MRLGEGISFPMDLMARRNQPCGDLASIIVTRGIHTSRAKILVTNFSREGLIVLGQFAGDGRLWTRIDRV
jgi:hypothetical protein